jgi:hypothetical protein
MVPEEVQSQLRIKSQLLAQIQSVDVGSDISRIDARGLSAFIAALPVTGRVVVEKTDPRWLEVNPQQDPFLKKGQRVVIPARPTSVTVVKGDGSLCQVTHAVELYAKDYARSCDAEGSPHTVWLVQPDGLIQRAGVAGWNQSKQNSPAPGAWIVVADAKISWPEEILSQVARLLATQGVAPDRLSGLPVSDSARRLVAAKAAPDKNLTSRIGTVPDVEVFPVDSGPVILPAPARGTDLFGKPERPHDNALTANDWGLIGLIQTPSARMESAGNAAVTVSNASPYTRMTGSMQLMDWFTLGVRWTDISNRLYGTANFSGNQSYKDKSVDAKVKLLNETAMLPQLAMGLTDLGGTGLFSGEYLVASKRTGDLDWSLGLGWGYLGARGNQGNPLSVFGSQFGVRPAITVAQGGTVNSSSMFRGPTSLFGGVQYQTPWESLILKL